MTATPTNQTEEAFVRNPDVLHSDAGDAVVALDVASGNCFSFDGPSRRIWDLLETPHTPDALVRQLVEEFEVAEETCLAETREYLARLEDEGLVRRAPAG